MAVETTYPNYQQLRSRWVPRVPEHWSLLRAKNFLREIDDRSKTGEETLLSMRMQRGLVPHNDVSVKRIAPENLIGYKKAQPDELVLNRMQAGNAMFFRNRQSGLVSPDYAVFRLLRDDNPEYLGHLFRSWPMRGLFRSESKGLGTGTSGFLRLYSDRFASLEIPLPPRPEQDQIVAYLRAQDAHIARFIQAKRDLIKLLTEQKLRIIDHAVTCGLDAAVALKTSGIEWLGEVPEHWEVLRLRRLAKDSIKNGVGESAQHFREDWPRYIRITDIAGPTALKDSTKASLPPKVASRAPLNPGDLLFAAVGATFGKSYLHTQTGHPCCYAGYLVKVSPNELVTSEFLSLWAQSNVYWDQLRSQVIQATIQNFSASRYKDLVVPVPPVEEQQAICCWITDECQPLDEVISRTEDEIKLIREYRDRQIADVVTGQVDVRGWQPGPDDVVDDTALAALGDDPDDVTEEEDGDGED